MSEMTYEGQVKFYDHTKGFGFLKVISDDKKDTEVYVHVSNVSPNVSSRLKFLKTGEYCCFNLTESDENGVKASNVRGIDNGPLLWESNPKAATFKSSSRRDVETGKGSNTWSSVVKGDQVSNKYWGVVNWFDNRLAYGFIKVKGVMDKDAELSPETESIFVHYTSLQPFSSTYKALVNGEYVSFDIKKNKKEGKTQFQAVDVKGYKEGSLICDHNLIPKKSLKEETEDVKKPTGDTVSIPTDEFIKLLSKLK